MITIKKLLTQYGFDNNYIDLLSYLLLIIIIVLSCILSIIISKHIINKIIRFTSKKNKSKWNKYFYERNLYKRVTYVIPPIIIYNTANNFGEYETVLIKFATIYLLFIVALIVHSFLEAINDIYIKYEISKTRPIKGLLQVVLISIDIVITVIAIATLFNKSPLVLLSGVGAAAAVFSFVFKDMILGFVAGIQLTANNMLRIGDWIEVTKSNAEGVVIDISLIAIKIQCFDKGVVTIPAYHLVSDSFKNWRPMLESGARRLKKSIIIDINSIKFCSDEDIEKYKKINYLKDYILDKEKEIKNYNIEQNVNVESALSSINGRKLTNIGTFRAYIINYLNNNSNIRKDMPIVVKQQPATHQGLPLEIYTFIDNINFAEFESIQSDIFDHIFAVIGEFDLQVYQAPTGEFAIKYKES